MIVDFTPLPALAGGALIGLAASLYLRSHGAATGISGLWAALLGPPDDRTGQRLSWMIGLLAGGVLLVVLRPEFFAVPAERSLGAIAVAGGLVGVGTRLGGGCTSGHGVCGLSRLSWRSLAAVLTFMAAGFGIASGIGFATGGAL